MFQQNLSASRRAQLSGLAFGLALLLVGSSQAQEGEAASSTQVEVQQANAPAEQVIVTGQRTLRSLVNEAAIETENFYNRLNLVLDNPDFEISCRNENPPGSNISRKVCRMRYQEDLESRSALSAIQGFGTTDEGIMVFDGTSFDQQPELLRMQRQFETELLQAVNSDPELNASVVRLLRLKAAVDTFESPSQQERRLEREASE